MPKSKQHKSKSKFNKKSNRKHSKKNNNAKSHKKIKRTKKNKTKKHKSLNIQKGGAFVNNSYQTNEENIQNETIYQFNNYDNANISILKFQKINKDVNTFGKIYYNDQLILSENLKSQLPSIGKIKSLYELLKAVVESKIENKRDNIKVSEIGENQYKIGELNNCNYFINLENIDTDNPQINFKINDGSGVLIKPIGLSNYTIFIKFMDDLVTSNKKKL